MKPKSFLVLALFILTVFASVTEAMSGPSTPSYLKGYEALYAKDPRAASVEWFKDAKFGLFVHYALASLCTDGKAEYGFDLADGVSYWFTVTARSSGVESHMPAAVGPFVPDASAPVAPSVAVTCTF